MQVLKSPVPWVDPTSVSGMAGWAVKEATTRIAGASPNFNPDPKWQSRSTLLRPAWSRRARGWTCRWRSSCFRPPAFYRSCPNTKKAISLWWAKSACTGSWPRSGVLSIAYLAKPGQTLIVPAGNERECAFITLRPGYKDCRVAAISTLEEVVEFFAGKRKLENVLHQKIQFEPVISKAVDFGRIHGQAKAKRAAVIAAAGGHNLLMVGPPGEGKSMLATAMVGILPHLSDEEKVELTKIYSAYGEILGDGQAVTAPPVPGGTPHRIQRVAGGWGSRRYCAPEKLHWLAAGSCSLTKFRNSAAPPLRRCGSQSRTARSRFRVWEPR